MRLCAVGGAFGIPLHRHLLAWGLGTAAAICVTLSYPSSRGLSCLHQGFSDPQRVQACQLYVYW